MTIQCDICWEQLEKPPAPKPNSPGASIVKPKPTKSGKPGASSQGQGGDDNSSSGRVALPCGHLYHSACIKHWLDSQTARNEPRSCPGCRKKLAKSAKLCEIFPSVTDELERRITDQDDVINELSVNLCDAKCEIKKLEFQNQELRSKLDMEESNTKRTTPPAVQETHKAPPKKKATRKPDETTKPTKGKEKESGKTGKPAVKINSVHQKVEVKVEMLNLARAGVKRVAPATAPTAASTRSVRIKKPKVY